MMTDRELGRSDIIKNDEGGNFISLDDSTVLTLRKLYLEDRTVALSEELVGEGTACYRAKMPDSDRWEYVAKFKWRLESDRPERTLLKLAKEKNTWGVISIEYDKEDANTAILLQAHQRGRYRRFLTAQHRTEGSEAVRRRGQGSFCGIRGIMKDTEETNVAFEGRILTYVVVSPAGRPLQTFKNRLELLQVLRDAVKGHRSLFQDAKILHQDVSPQNIIITDAEHDGDPKGILIDFDVAMNLADGPRTPSEVVGTRPFMAIGILRKRRHTYRHDLESFLYVFLWTVIAERAENPPRTSRLRQWNKGSWDESAMKKTHDMNHDNFAVLLAGFTPEFDSLKPLAETLRQILFPIEENEIWTGTDSAPIVVNRLYNEIVSAFNAAINQEITDDNHAVDISD